MALNVFLRCQPIYWCFVPITVEQAMADDSGLTSTEASILMEGSAKATADSVSPYHRPPSLIHWCLRNVPLPPSTHQFSLRQRIEQYGFFRDRLDLFPTRFLDLYNAAMVMTSQYAHLPACMHLYRTCLFLAPSQCSADMRHFIQALLVACAEPRLNTTEPAMAMQVRQPWYEHLVHPRRCSSRETL